MANAYRVDAFEAGESAAPQALTKTAVEKLKQMVARIEKLEEEKRSVADDIKESYAEAKTLGYDTKALRKVISLRRMERKDREELEAMLDLYLHALGEI